MRKVIIIGSGPAGHTAAIYASRATLEPLMFEGMMAGDDSSLKTGPRFDSTQPHVMLDTYY